MHVRCPLGFSLVLVASFAAALATQGAEFRVLGPDALSMGGACAARWGGSYAVYHNPACLALPGDTTEVALSAGAAGRDLDMGEHLDRLADYDWDEAMDNPLGADASAIVAELLTIDENSGFLLSAAGGLGVRVKSVGTGCFLGLEAAGYVVIDRVHTNRTPDFDPNSFAHNESQLFLNGIAVGEVPVGYGHLFDLGRAGKLAVGGAVKFLYGDTFVTTVTVDNAEDLGENYKEYEEQSWNFGVDAGLLYRCPKDRFSLGAVARNLNAPSFDTWDGGSVSIDPQVRAGIEVDLVPKKLSAAADIDLTANETVLAGYKSRMLGGGLDFHPVSWFSMRLGLMKNIASNSQTDPGIVYTGGLAIGFKQIHLNVAAATAMEKKELEGEEYRPDMRVAAALESNW